MTAFREYQYALGPNKSVNIDVKGEYFRVARSTGLVRVFLADTGQFVDLLPGQGLKNTPFERLIVQDLTGSNNNGSLYVATGGEFVDFRITGQVEVIDGGRSRTLAAQSFIAPGYQGPTVAQLAHVQLLNPAASGKRAIIKSIDIGSNTTGGFQLCFYDIALTTLYGMAIAKLRNGAAGATSVYTATLAAQVGTPIFFGFVSANALFTKLLQEPIVLLPGQGFLARHTAANADLTCNAELVEEAVTA